MTLSINGSDIAQIVQVAASVFSILLMLVVGWFVYLMVRPSRKGRERPAREADPAEAEEMWRIVDLMERRLALLERSLAERAEDRRERDFLLADEGRDSGRKE